MLRGDLVADVRYLAWPLMQLTYEQLECWLQPIEFERFQLLPIFWRANQHVPLFLQQWMSQCYDWVLWEQKGIRVKNQVWSCFSYKIIWPNFCFTFPVTPKRRHFLNSFWWADCAMSIHLHLYKLAVTPGGLSLLLRATRVVQINKSLFYNWNKFPIFRMKKQDSRETLS